MRSILAIIQLIFTLINSTTLVEAFTTTTRSFAIQLGRHHHHHVTIPNSNPTPHHHNNDKRKPRETKLHAASPVELWDAYNQALVANPLIVKSVTACGLLGCADFAGQLFEKSKGSDKDIDFLRTLRFAIFGLVLQAPWNHFYYQVLDAQIPPTEDPFSQTNILKIIIDQFIQAPIFTVLIFVFLGALEGKAISDIQKQLKEDYPSTIVANWKLWVPATVINIGFVPPILRVLYLNVVFFFWSIYLSLVINKGDSSQTK